MTASAQDYGVRAARRLSVFRVGVATSLTAVVFLLLCWIGAAIGIGPASHMVIQLFSGFAATSVTSLLLGLCWALIGGFVAGTVFAIIYNLLAVIER